MANWDTNEFVTLQVYDAYDGKQSAELAAGGGPATDEEGEIRQIVYIEKPGWVDVNCWTKNLDIGISGSDATIQLQVRPTQSGNYTTLADRTTPLDEWTNISGRYYAAEGTDVQIRVNHGPTGDGAAYRVDLVNFSASGI